MGVNRVRQRRREAGETEPDEVEDGADEAFDDGDGQGGVYYENTEHSLRRSWKT